MIKKLQEETNENLAKYNNYFLSQANLNFVQFEQISKILSSHKRDLNSLISDFNTDVLTTFIKDTEREALIVLAGGMPDSSDWVKDLLALCLETNDSKSFCSKVTLSEHLSFKNVYFVVDRKNEILELKVQVLMPQMTHLGDGHPFLYHSQNIGFHIENSGFVKIDIPETFLQRMVIDPITNEPVREIVEIQNCHRAICPVSEMSYTDRCPCIKNILDGNTKDCKFRKIEQFTPYCSFIKLNRGLLVTASDASFSIRSNQFTQPEVTIRNQTKLIGQEGQLKCKGGNFNQIHNFIDREIVKKSDINRFKMLKTKFNFSDLSEIQSMNQIFEDRLKSIESLTKNEFISLKNGNYIPVDSLISWITTFTLSVILIIGAFLIYKNFAAIKAQFRAPMRSYIPAEPLDN